MSLDADQIFKNIMEAGEDWADKKAAFNLLEDMTKTNLADLITDYMVNSSSKAVAEQMALASKPFKDHLASLAGARRAWLLAEVRYKGF